MLVRRLGLEAGERERYFVVCFLLQDPVLFSGSFRHNLDPFEQHTDDRLWEVLNWVQLKTAVSEMAGHTNVGNVSGAMSSGLYAPMAECGDNLSAGQKQVWHRRSKMIVTGKFRSSHSRLTQRCVTIRLLMLFSKSISQLVCAEDSEVFFGENMLLTTQLIRVDYIAAAREG